MLWASSQLTAAQLLFMAQGKYVKLECWWWNCVLKRPLCILTAYGSQTATVRAWRDCRTLPSLGLSRKKMTSFWIYNFLQVWYWTEHTFRVSAEIPALLLSPEHLPNTYWFPRGLVSQRAEPGLQRTPLCAPFLTNTDLSCTMHFLCKWQPALFLHKL